VLIALAPLVRRGLVAPGSAVNIVAASGVTGAGFTPKPELMFAEVAGDYRAYGVGNTHRHLAEMSATVNSWGADLDLVFTPHLLPVPRGILTTMTVTLVNDLPDAMAPWREDYDEEPFVELTQTPPALREVVGRNAIRIHAAKVAGMRNPTLLVIAALDNLVKGAAGQAVQNANVMLGLPEIAGLPA
jgi:N-acetyl-gamma-glutamyl-phosphate reductase